MPQDTLKRIDDTICSEDFLGFDPASNSTKPPHIANGLFRRCTGEHCDTRQVHEWVNTNEKRGATSSEELVKKYSGILINGEAQDTNQIKQLRYFLHEIFNQDQTAYPSYEFSVMSITSHLLIKSKVNSEGGIGDFLFDILSKEIDGSRSSVIQLLQEVLARDNDDLTSLIKPIIVVPNEDGREKITRNGVIYTPDEKIKWDSCKATLRNGYDQLASNIISSEENKNSLLVLRRIVDFSVFAAYLYLIHSNHALYNGFRVPIIVEAGAELNSIRRASEQAFITAKKSVEDYYINTIHCILRQEIAKDNVDNCRHWIASMLVDEPVRAAVESYFRTFATVNDSAIYALARALQIVIYTFEYKSNSPTDFCRVLGVRGGFVGPKGNNAKKRYILNSFTLETLVLSTLSEEELSDGIELKELGDKLMSSYNIIFGANAEQEYRLLEECNIAQSTPGDLRGDLSINAQQLANTFIALGLGKRYADGVTLIGRGL